MLVKVKMKIIYSKSARKLFFRKKGGPPIVGGMKYGIGSAKDGTWAQKKAARKRRPQLNDRETASAVRSVVSAPKKKWFRREVCSVGQNIVIPVAD